MMQFEIGLDDLERLINRLNTEMGYGLVYHRRNDSKAVWSVGNSLIIAYRVIENALTELELKGLADKIASNGWRNLIESLKRNEIPYRKTKDLAHVAKKWRAKRPPYRPDYPNQELYQEAQQAFTAEQERRENMTIEQAVADEFLGRETRATIVDVAQTTPFEQEAGQKPFPEKQSAEFDCPQDELLDVLIYLSLQEQWPQGYSLNAPPERPTSDYIQLKIDKQRILNPQGRNDYEYIGRVTINKIGSQLSALSVRSDNRDLLQFFDEIIKVMSKYVHMRSEPAAQADLTAKATLQSPIIFQVNNYVKGNKEDHSIHVGNISNSAGVAIGESARVNIDQSAGQSEKPQEPKAITQPGASQYEKAVFVSYAWGGKSERIVDELEQAFAKRGIRIARDKKDIDYKGSIEEFEQRIGQGQCIVLVISDKYLRSEHCMYELVEADKHKNLRDRIFPIVLADAQIYKAIDRLAYIKHWDEQIEQLNQAMKQVGVMTYMNGIHADLNKYADIRASFDHLAGLLRDMNALTPEIHATSGFSTLIDAVVHAMTPK